MPASVTLEWLGYPQDEWQWFSDTFHGISAYPAGSPEHHEASKAYGPVLARIDEELRDRIASPRDDALTAIAHHEVDGERLPEDVAQSIAFLTTVGGIDTTTALAGGALLHLSQFPADRQRLVDEPELLPLATEEFLRFYPPARAHKRIVAADTEFGGVTMHEGDEVLLSEVAAGRDAAEFPDADTFVIDRNPNRHVSFGVGIHRCPGSHLARITFSEMITAVLQRMPDYDDRARPGRRLPRLGDGRRMAAHAGDVHADARADPSGGPVAQRRAGTARRGVPRLLRQGVPADARPRRRGARRLRPGPLGRARGDGRADDGGRRRTTAAPAPGCSTSSSSPSGSAPRSRRSRSSTRG